VTKGKVLVDCFLYSDQSPYRELLGLRLALLGEVVDRFVVVASRQTFSGRMLPSAFPEDDPVVQRFRDRIELVLLGSLDGVTPRRREEVTRNAVSRGLADLPDDALVMVSDIDELPRPDVLVHMLEGRAPRSSVVLALDYFNYKFNYRLVQGVQQVWAGPVIAPLSLLGVPQEARQARWSLMHDPDRVVHDAGWHFSFLTETDDVRQKLDTMFVAREIEWRGSGTVSAAIAGTPLPSSSQRVAASTTTCTADRCGLTWTSPSSAARPLSGRCSSCRGFCSRRRRMSRTMWSVAELSRCGACTTKSCRRSCTTRLTSNLPSNLQPASQCVLGVSSVRPDPGSARDCPAGVDVNANWYLERAGPAPGYSPPCQAPTRGPSAGWWRR
jgi:beta-1,4-mannosyl-glycoprotein beta-1,4-N-acetylglucosaminyltransferase